MVLFFTPVYLTNRLIPEEACGVMSQCIGFYHRYEYGGINTYLVSETRGALQAFGTLNLIEFHACLCIVVNNSLP